MRTAILISLILFIVIGSCKKHVPPLDTRIETPYPSLAEQRARLATKPWVTPTRILDSIQIINDLKYLASDACEGRKPGTAGHTRAMERILTRMRTAGLDSFENSMIQVFAGADSTKGKNIVGWLKGTSHPEKHIVISAHYDHLGKTPNRETYYGADDNASGVACLLALATYFKNNPHTYSLIFAAFDKEETRFEGAYHFVSQWVKRGQLAAIAFNLNMDMIARSDSNEIFASGILHYPQFMYAIDAVQPKTNIKVLMGHDGQRLEADWTNLSDHWVFHERFFIPYMYIGVEDHPDYHQPTDTYDKINYSRYIETCNMIALLTQALKP
jgi:hypothetical protein